MTKTIRFVGVYQNIREIRLDAGNLIHWEHLSAEAPPRLPYGSRIEIHIKYEERDYLHGTDGIVWATYEVRQAETIQAALLAQRIGCEVRAHSLPGGRLYVLCTPNTSEVAAAVDFIWREPGGLRLQPDWWYPAGAANASFNKWIDGV